MGRSVPKSILARISRWEIGKEQARLGRKGREIRLQSLLDLLLCSAGTPGSPDPQNQDGEGFPPATISPPADSANSERQTDCKPKGSFGGTRMYKQLPKAVGDAVIDTLHCVPASTISAFRYGPGPPKRQTEAVA